MGWGRWRLEDGGDLLALLGSYAILLSGCSEPEGMGQDWAQITKLVEGQGRKCDLQPDNNETSQKDITAPGSSIINGGFRGPVGCVVNSVRL